VDDTRFLDKLAQSFGGPGQLPGALPAAASGPDLGPAEELVTPFGPCLRLVSGHAVHLAFPAPALAEGAVAQALSLLYGVGPVREEGLRASGVRTLADLAHHPRHGAEARRWLAALAGRDLPTLYRGICRWYSASHTLLLYLLALASPQELVFLDLESLGLSGLPTFLAGVGRLDGKGLRVHQYLARSLGEEPAILWALLTELPARPFVVSYNGKAHDWNHLQARLAYHGLTPLPEAAHLDLLFFARRRWGRDLADCSLAQVERAVLGLSRAVDVPSAYVPACYQAYLRTGSVAPLVPVVAHNREDVTTLARLLAVLLAEVAEGA
jgi:uncharacterized protein YprB with RNaseH-like and TPR domain